MKNILLLSIVLIVGLLLAVIVMAQEAVQRRVYNKLLNKILSHSVKEVDVNAAFDEYQYGNTLFLDARESKEFAISHINEAQYVGYEDFDTTLVANLSKDQPIVVYCSIGYRSEKIAERLVEMGFQDVANLYGGIFEWKNQGKQVVDKQGETEKVHGYNRTWGIWLRKGEKVYE